MGDLDRMKTIVVHCKSGYRGSVAASLLLSAGFPHVVALTGGYDAWTLAHGSPMETKSHAL